MLHATNLIGFGAGGGVGNDQYTKILLHFDGTSGSTLIADSNINVARVWTNSGAVLSSAQSKFGTTSVYLNNLQYPNLPYTISPPPASSGIVWGTQDFTIDFWLYPVTGNGYALAWHGDGGSFATTAFVLSLDLSNRIRMTLSNGAVALCDYTSSAALSPGTWSHVAVVRSGATVVTYIGGIAYGSASIGGGSVVSPGAAYPYYIGPRGSAIDFTANCFMDEHRLSIGIARWTSNFTPPSEPYD